MPLMKEYVAVECSSTSEFGISGEEVPQIGFSGLPCYGIDTASVSQATVVGLCLGVLRGHVPKYPQETEQFLKSLVQPGT